VRQLEEREHSGPVVETARLRPGPFAVPGPSGPRHPSARPARRDRVCRCRVLRTAPSAWSKAQSNPRNPTTLQRGSTLISAGARASAIRSASSSKRREAGRQSFFREVALEPCAPSRPVNSEIRGTDVIYTDHYTSASGRWRAARGLWCRWLRECRPMSFAELEKTIGDLAVRGATTSLMMKDLEGGTFTISNGGLWIDVVRRRS